MDHDDKPPVTPEAAAKIREQLERHVRQQDTGEFTRHLRPGDAEYAHALGVTLEEVPTP